MDVQSKTDQSLLNYLAGQKKARAAVGASTLILASNGEGGDTSDDLITVQGAVDSITPNIAVGWAWSPVHPDSSVQIEALIGDEIIGRATADRPRSDLSNLKNGSTRYGFVLLFERPLKDDELPTIRAVAAEHRLDLPAVEWTVVEGYVDLLTKDLALGWAWMPSNGLEPLEVHAVVDGTVVGKANCNILRHDLLEWGKGNGNCGFHIDFSPPLGGNAVPQFRVLHSSGTTVLPGAKWAKADLQFDYLTNENAVGWAWIPRAPNITVHVEARIGGRRIGGAIANTPRPDLAEHGIGTGQYGFDLKFDRVVSAGTKPLFVAANLDSGEEIECPLEMLMVAVPVVSSEPAAPPNPEHSEKILGIEGHIDLLTRGAVAGWAWWPQQPESSVYIEAFISGHAIGRTIADVFRPDLAAAGKGTGLYGFNLRFDEVILTDEVPEIRVQVTAPVKLYGGESLPPRSLADTVLRSRGTMDILLREHGLFTKPGPEFEEFDPQIFDGFIPPPAAPKPHVLAFYLPQFHPIDENDVFWGKGFTEWRQLPKALPRFPGHYQPRTPRDLGFYDLLQEDAMRRQADMARSAGVSSFAFYYYWFDRKRVLEKPLEMLLESDIEMPFLLIWANENWTRTWDGSDSEVLLGQSYADEDDLPLVADLARHFGDPRYVRVNGRPLFIIYNPKNIPEAKAKLAHWRDLFRDEFNLQPLIFMAQTFGARDPTPFGLDGAMEFPPHKLSDKLPGRPTPDAYSSAFSGRVISYDDFVLTSLDEDPQDFPLIKTVVPSWDNDCRRPNRGLTLEGISPKKYERWLHELLLRAMESPIEGTPFVAVNAWNEWAESAYLEPDVYYGSGFLNATARAYRGSVEEFSHKAQHTAEPHPEERVTVIFPNFNHERFIAERINTVLQQSHPPDEIIFLDDCSSDNSVAIARELLEASVIPHRIVVNTENSGGVFRQWIKGLSLASNPLIWVAETDDSVHRDFLKYLLPSFKDGGVSAAFGRMSCISPEGEPVGDLDGYFDGFTDFSWKESRIVPAHRAFQGDFAIRNVIPNASGLVFRKPHLTEAEIERLYEYKFAGDWYFYALMLRGGALAYNRSARSYFRVNPRSASRSAFFTDRHLQEHAMLLQDISNEYGLPMPVFEAHVDQLLTYFCERPREELLGLLAPQPAHDTAHRPLRLCIAAHGFAVGGGEVLPVELANGLKSLGHHVTYLVIEDEVPGTKSVRHRLRSDIPVVLWEKVKKDFVGFVASYGFDVINSHNVSVEFNLYCSHAEINVPYIASLHGGYETVPDLLTPDFAAYLKRVVKMWLPLAEKNTVLLREKGIDPALFRHSFNAVPALSDVPARAEVRALHGIPDDAFTVVLCSRAIVEKGWGLAIEIVKQLVCTVSRPLHLVLIGDGPCAADLMAENKDCGFVSFLGHVERPARLFAGFDLGILPSTFAGETFPMFMLECFQAGLPVVATDIGEIPRIMGPHENARPGAIVAYNLGRDHIINEMIWNIFELVESPEAYDKAQVTARARSDEFSMERLQDFYLRNMKSLASGNATSDLSVTVDMATPRSP